MNVEFWLFAGLVAGVYLFYRGFRLLLRRRLIENTPTSRIRSAAMGLVEVCGLAQGPYTLVAPITGAACYCYQTIAWQWKKSGRKNTWQKVAEENLHVPFFLDDNTGQVLVDPRGAEMEIHRDFREEFAASLFSSSADLPANVAGFLLRHGVSTDRRTRIEEHCIKPKNALYILGTLAENPGLPVAPTPLRTTDGKALVFDSEGFHPAAQSPLNQPAPEVEVISLSPGRGPQRAAEMTAQGKIAAAMAKAGIASPAAWSVAGVSLPGAARQQNSPEQSGHFDLHPKTVLCKGENDRTFFISWRSQREILRGLAWQSTLMIWGGPALTLACLYLLLQQWGRF
ncbi:MAG: hypothetical protein JST79_20990 [Acidobacteria bacterium]|nr:hypothetical protein [Acidobacteriota bacterium]